MPAPSLQPDRDCPRCPRLVALRTSLRREQPGWWNAPVPVLGEPARAWLAIVGLAPGMHGANRTGRAFTGDASGELLFATLAKFGLARESEPHGVVILNAVRCLPPANRPLGAEINACRDYLAAEAAAIPQVRLFVALGRIAHDSLVRALGGRPAAARFGHLAEHALPGGRTLIDSYHCSRYNQNTGRLTPAMFEAVFARAVALREARPA